MPKDRGNQISAPCQRVRETLDAYAAGLAEAADIDQEHLKQCPQCAKAFWESSALRRSLLAYARSAEEESRGVERELAARLKAPPEPAPAPARRSFAWAQAVAAAALLLVAMMALWQWQAPDRQPSNTSPMARDFLEEVQRESGKEEILRYLDRSQLVLAALMDTARDCADGDQVEIAYEKRLAASLLFEKQLLDPQLAGPGNEGVRKLCDELELVLIDVASSDTCVDPSQIEMWRDLLDSRSTLMKLRMARREAAI